MKQQRTLIVMIVAVAVATVAALGVRQAIARIPVQQVEVGSVPVVVAAQAIPMGTRLTRDHLKLVAWPSRTPVPGAFADPETLLGRGVIVPVGEHEPFTAAKVAGPEDGAGLPPLIPAGMRAISVRVNEVVGVAGFVVPGTRVDVLVAVDDDGDDSTRKEPMARTVVGNVQVLTAGTRYDQEVSKDGKPQKSTVVTLAVQPADAERVALAATEGEISLVLRNPVDVAPTMTTGIKLAALMRGTTPEPVAPAPRRTVVTRTVVAQAPAPAAPQIYRVEAIRAAKRTEEAVH